MFLLFNFQKHNFDKFVSIYVCKTILNIHIVSIFYVHMYIFILKYSANELQLYLVEDQAEITNTNYKNIKIYFVKTP